MDTRLIDELTGLVWPLRCPGCGAPDVEVCRRCLAVLAPPPQRRWPPAWPDGPGVWVRAEYSGTVLPRLLPAWKDRGRHRIGRLLAPGLAGGCAAGLLEAPAGAPVRLVPVPSTRAARRRRGADVVADLAGAAAARLHGAERPVELARVLRHRRRVRDQAGLGAAQRRANLAGALEAVGVRPGDLVLVVDDVVTTGASMAAAAAALRAAGARVIGAAALAATP